MKKLLLILLCLPMISLGQCCSDESLTENLIGSTIVTKTSNSADQFTRSLLSSNKFLSSQNGVIKPGKTGDSWFVSDGILHIYYNEHITYRIPLDDPTYDMATWNNKSGSDGHIIVIKFDRSPITFASTVSSCIKFIVEDKVNEWQQKGEFEKTKDYLDRVNGINRNAQIEEFQQLAIEEMKLDFFNLIDFSEVRLDYYDADNETFLIEYPLSHLDNFVISVPIEEAKSFKDSFSKFRFLNPKFEIYDDKFVLSYLELTNRSKTYIYNSSSAQDYDIIDIDYDFPSIEIDDMNAIKKDQSININTKKIKIGVSSVNTNIPTNKKVKNRYALIIGNEDYSNYQTSLSSEQNVDYAINDATIFQKYCLNTLGVKEDNMFFLTNAGYVKMQKEINRVIEIVSASGKNTELIFYYAGHGYPDEITKVPYLIPVDVAGEDLSYAIKLDDLYKSLGDTKAKRITIFLDACFTGGARNAGLIASRGVKVKPKEGLLNGNIVVFSASSETQSALPYHEERHGVFTYHLLKSLQESKGDISYEELFNKLEKDVNITSLKKNSKKQNPEISVSPAVKDWKDWKF